MRIITTILIYLSLVACSSEKKLVEQDWPNLKYYRSKNLKLGSPSKSEKRVVFMGNSITEGWPTLQPEFFESKSYINRGISGQTTPQMLIRFRQDVIDLKPKLVLILAGINDIAGNTGPSNVTMITNNIISMAQLAKSNKIKVIICSILPAKDFPWNPGMNPPPKILNVNQILRSYALANGMVYLDYYSLMVDESNALIDEYGSDGVHPNKEGYKVMSLLAEQEINRILNQ
jgi:lysophospholipase L1-like esterase|tara:strand:+ start:482 stop:1174 length:693 start_codon:yes stop_codon:yes gene_type:complete